MSDARGSFDRALLAHLGSSLRCPTSERGNDVIRDSDGAVEVDELFIEIARDESLDEDLQLMLMPGNSWMTYN